MKNLRFKYLHLNEVTRTIISFFQILVNFFLQNTFKKNYFGRKKVKFKREKKLCNKLNGQHLSL